MALAADQRSMREWLDSYSQDHQHPINRLLHWICVPLIVWSALALLWTVPVPASLLRPGAYAVFAIVLAFAWYWKRSHRLGAALLIALAILALICAWVFDSLGPAHMRWLALGVFAAAWIGQFIGHLSKDEGRASLPILPIYSSARRG
ncbi:Mpo1-like protein [Dyella sp.]|uniref:Mpo1 family 2-hydroxy fatty acid dioxygenase n=1 Tax=Dyella sp. TaxID=1869338 RepID=UPI002FDA4E1D